jgi:hypothetical protein
MFEYVKIFLYAWSIYAYALIIVLFLCFISCSR